MNRRSFFASIIGATLAAKLLPVTQPVIPECKFWSVDERIVTLSTPRSTDWVKRYYTITGTDWDGNIVTEKIGISTRASTLQSQR